MTILILYALLGLVVSFACSLLEAALLSLPRSSVKLLKDSGSRAGALLAQMKGNIDRPLAAILTLNTVAHTVGAAGVGGQAAKIYGDTAVGIAGAVMTVLILLLSEIIPKTLGAVHAKKIAVPVAYVLHWMIWLMIPIIIPIEWFNRLFRRVEHGVQMNRAELLATLQLGQVSGALDDREFTIMANLIKLRSVTIEEILTPRPVVFSLSANMSVQEALDTHHPIRFARIPVYEESLEHVIGYVPRFAIHAAHSAGQAQTPLRDLLQPITVLPEFAKVGEVLDSFIREKRHLAIVVDEYGGLSGVVSLEDLLETLLGDEIVDESDPVMDMQTLARERLQQRNAQELGAKDSPERE